MDIFRKSSSLPLAPLSLHSPPFPLPSPPLPLPSLLTPRRLPIYLMCRMYFQKGSSGIACSSDNALARNWPKNTPRAGILILMNILGLTKNTNKEVTNIRVLPCSLNLFVSEDASPPLHTTPHHTTQHHTTPHYTAQNILYMPMRFALWHPQYVVSRKLVGE